MNRERVPFVLTPDFLYVMGRVNGRSSLYFQRFRVSVVVTLMGSFYDLKMSTVTKAFTKIMCTRSVWSV